MHLYSIEIVKDGACQNPPLTHIVDLDYIVSISYVDTWNPDPMAHPALEAFFFIYLKLGEPIRIAYDSGYRYRADPFPQYILDKLIAERDKLIKTWESKSSTVMPDWKAAERDCGVQVIPVDDFQRGRHQGVRDCYDYIYKQITY